MLQLKIQVLSDGFSQVVHTQAIQDGKAVPGGGKPDTQRTDIKTRSMSGKLKLMSLKDLHNCMWVF